MANFVETKLAEIRKQVGPSDKVLMGLSGGVDSSVAAALIHRAIGPRLHCVFVDTGLLRAGERDRMENTFAGQLGIDLKVTDASDLFLSRLAGVIDPEQKRRIIGHTFIDVFESEDVVKGAKFLGQGTLYPDVIESVSFKGPSAVIQEPSQCRRIAGAECVWNWSSRFASCSRMKCAKQGDSSGSRQRSSIAEPFPGPGLAVRIVGEVTRDRLDLLRRADRDRDGRNGGRRLRTQTVAGRSRCCCRSRRSA